MCGFADVRRDDKGFYCTRCNWVADTNYFRAIFGADTEDKIPVLQRPTYERLPP